MIPPLSFSESAVNLELTLNLLRWSDNLAGFSPT